MWVILRFVEKIVAISFISETIPLSSWPKPEHMFSFVADILSIIPLKLVQLKLAVNCSSTDFDHYDDECKIKLRHVKSLGRLLNKSPWQRGLRHKVLFEKKQYNKLLRKKYRAFKAKLLNNLLDTII
jgi:hypothetical protein